MPDVQKMLEIGFSRRMSRELSSETLAFTITLFSKLGVWGFPARSDDC